MQFLGAKIVPYWIKKWAFTSNFQCKTATGWIPAEAKVVLVLSRSEDTKPWPNRNVKVNFKLNMQTICINGGQLWFCSKTSFNKVFVTFQNKRGCLLRGLYVLILAAAPSEMLELRGYRWTPGSSINVKLVLIYKKRCRPLSKEVSKQKIIFNCQVCQAYLYIQNSPPICNFYEVFLPYASILGTGAILFYKWLH